jgi:lysophospholipid acyltransferase (LPLAT)-like uncharacterized protein
MRTALDRLVAEERDRALTFWHGEHELPATAFPKGYGAQREVVEQ